MEIPPSITEQRASIGLTTPTAAERTLIWSQISIPQANIRPETGGYRPHRLIKRLHDGPWRFVAEGGGLRLGKSLGSGAECVAWLPHSNLIWLVAETYDLCRQEFEYIAEAATSLDWVGDLSMPKKKYDPCAMETPWGCRVESRSLHDLGTAGEKGSAALSARAPDLIIVCEPGFAPMETLPQARERLTTRRGRLWMAGTFEKANTWFVETWHKWARWPNPDMGKSLAVPSWLNTVSFPGGRHDPEMIAIERQYPTIREFLVRWGGVPLASEAIVMGNYWDEKRHVASTALFQSHDRNGAKQPVYLAIDPGYSGKSVYAVLALQRFGDNYVVIDEVIGSTLVHEEVIDLCRAKPWWPNVVSGVIDPYAGVNHVYGGIAPLEIWWRYARVPIVPAPRLEVEEAVSRLQLVMRDPANAKTHVVVNPEAKRLRWEMSHWRRVQTREGLGKPSEANCDAVKALAYFMTAKYTEHTLGIGPGYNAIKVSDWTLGGRSTGEALAHRQLGRGRPYNE